MATSDRKKIAAQAAANLRAFARGGDPLPVMIGFDGFVDSIISVVDKRYDTDQFEPVRTISHFGQKVLAAAGMSSNFELVVRLEKLGGNGPIMASALASLGFPVTYIGGLGFPSLHPVFEEFGRIAKVYSVAQPGYTDAMEFTDGKLMLGKYSSMNTINWKRLQEVIGPEELVEIIQRSRLIGMVNWTMLPGQPDIWRHMIDLLKAAPPAAGKKKHVFIDLADPEKRTAADIRNALSLCSAFQKHVDATLGLNLKESTQVARVLGIDPTADPEKAIESTAGAIRQKLGLYTVVIHPRGGAAAARQKNSKVESASFQGPFVAHPKLSTGAGDNFNAGFCLGELADLSLEQCLCVGTATSGYYVRNAASPTLEQLARFCENLPDPE